MSALIGHDAAWREWRTALASPRMHHGWILTGLRGLGKASFARAAAAELVAEPGRVAPDAAAHPDILSLEPLPATDAEEAKKAEGKSYQTKRNISVDQIRRMQQRLTTRPTLGSRRAIIIDAADDLEKGAVNALLKSLEEPPQGTFFILVTHRLGRLLPTVRSRCRTLRFAPLGGEQITMILDGAAPGSSLSGRLAAAAASEGSPGAALGYLSQDLGAVHPIMLRLLREGDPRLELRGQLADEIGTRPTRERTTAVLDLARATMAAEFRASAGAAQSRMIDAHGDLVRLAAQVPTYNFDPGLLGLEIGGLLARAAMPRDGAT